MQHIQSIIRTAPLLLTLALSLSGCIQSDNEVSAETIELVSGTWKEEGGTGSISFYDDLTAKITILDHQPPVRLISQYDQMENGQLGIALGGFWSGPLLITTDKLAEGLMTATLPDEEPAIYRKQ